MSNKTRIIKIANNKLYYTSSDFIDISQTNFPQSAIFNKRHENYWLIKITEYIKNIKTLKVEVIDYSPSNIEVFFQQKAKTKINKFEFYNLKWQKLEPLLSSYQKLELSNIVDDINQDILTDNENAEAPTEKTELNLFEYKIIDTINSENKIKKYTINFNYYFKDTTFKLGYVEISKHFKFHIDKINLKIYNSNILPEYDFIKNYFPKVFNGKKQFKVKAIIEIKNNTVIKTRAYSKEINSINDELISSVKKLRTLELMKTVQTNNIDKSLFTADEIWDTATDDGQNGNIFKQSEEDIINILQNLPNVRNKKQLEYLAGAKHNPKEKIRFTLRPLFGFIFYIEGETMNHFCWELLNSHATYIWSFEKEERTDIQIKRVEEIINIVRDTGRKKYKSAYLRNEVDTDIFFNTVNHKHANSDFVESFVMWKHKFKELLV